MRWRGGAGLGIALSFSVSAALLCVVVTGTDDRPASDQGHVAGSKPSENVIQVQTAPRISLTDLSRQDYGGIRLPWSASDGPHNTKEGAASGFAQSPRGALLAAIHITVRANAVWGPQVFEQTISRQVTGPEVSELLTQTREAYEQQRQRGRLPYGRALGRAYVAIEAFRWLGYTPTIANLDLLTAGPGDSDVTVRAVTRVQLQWLHGDWRVVGPPDGDWAATATPITSTNGYSYFPANG
ncbi:hypothetical protein SMC26_24005 [Actinomadura fulvescens]|uniref:DUF8175 domain-containing protein n=1 Tax=Actinomadura fulvescens TaxID=46160 RepID=A0ABN3Q6K7_9ACTN